MNKLELTTEQIGRLIEMCNYFFKGEDVTNIENDFYFRTHHDDDEVPFVKMHWLEVCMTHLPSKIIYKSGKPLHYCKDTYFRLSDNLMKTFFGEDKMIHPVDFLYKEFEKNFKNDSK